MCSTICRCVLFMYIACNMGRKSTRVFTCGNGAVGICHEVRNTCVLMIGKLDAKNSITYLELSLQNLEIPTRILPSLRNVPVYVCTVCFVGTCDAPVDTWYVLGFVGKTVDVSYGWLCAAVDGQPFPRAPRHMPCLIKKLHNWPRTTGCSRVHSCLAGHLCRQPAPRCRAEGRPREPAHRHRAVELHIGVSGRGGHTHGARVVPVRV